MTRCQSRWVTVIIIALVVILRLPTLLPSLCLVCGRCFGQTADWEAHPPALIIDMSNGGATLGGASHDAIIPCFVPFLKNIA